MFAEVLLPMIQQPRVRGPIVHDARIAALCLEHGVGTVDGVHELLFNTAEDQSEHQDHSMTNIPMLVEFRKLLNDWEASIAAAPS